MLFEVTRRTCLPGRQLPCTHPTPLRRSAMATTGWLHWAILSAVFAALTAIFAKIGIAGVDSDLATLIRTVIVMLVLAAFVVATGKWTNPLALAPKTWLFLTLSALATG